MMPQNKTRRGRNEWTRLIAKYEAGAATQREFCQRHGLAHSTFCCWRKRLLQGAASDAGVEPLVELPLLPIDGPSPWRLELELGQGVVLRLR